MSSPKPVHLPRQRDDENTPTATSLRLTKGALNSFAEVSAKTGKSMSELMRQSAEILAAAVASPGFANGSEDVYDYLRKAIRLMEEYRDAERNGQMIARADRNKRVAYRIVLP